MKTSSTKRALAFWLAIAMLGGSAPTAFAAEMTTLQPAKKVASNSAVAIPEVDADTQGTQPQESQSEVVTPLAVVTIDHIKLDNKEVTVQGGSTGDTSVTATAHSSTGESGNTVSNVTWLIKEKNNGVTIDADDGKITVSAKAKAGTYTVVATPKSGSQDVTGGEKTATLTVKRATPVATTINQVLVDGVDVTEGQNRQITIPAGETRQLRATFLDQYSDAYTGQAEAVYTVEPKEGAPVSVSNTNLIVSADAAGTEVTITAKCKKVRVHRTEARSLL